MVMCKKLLYYATVTTEVQQCHELSLTRAVHEVWSAAHAALASPT